MRFVLVMDPKVPQGCRSLKVQAWGAGGGAGHFKGGQCGEGGGGAFAEAILYVAPDDELEVCLSRLRMINLRNIGGRERIFAFALYVPYIHSFAIDSVILSI